MAAMSTALVVKSIQGNTVQYALPNHTATVARLLTQISSPAEGKKRVSQISLRFAKTAVDADGVVIPEKDSFEVVVRKAVDGSGANWDAGDKTEILDILNSDEFWTNLINELPIKPL